MQLKERYAYLLASNESTLYNYEGLTGELESLRENFDVSNRRHLDMFQQIAQKINISFEDVTSLSALG